MSNNIMKTFSATPKDITRNWFVVDAQDLVLGRMSTIVANYLRGKHKAIFTPHMDCGDNIIIINAEKVFLTGNKMRDKRYYWHTGYPGGIKFRTAKQIINAKFPTRVIRKSITRMIGRTPLGRDVLKKLYVYAGNEHPHAGQNPTKLDIAVMNTKNTKR